MSYHNIFDCSRSLKHWPLLVIIELTIYMQIPTTVEDSIGIITFLMFCFVVAVRCSSVS